jgi:hypothetical protein
LVAAERGESARSLSARRKQLDGESTFNRATWINHVKELLKSIKSNIEITNQFCMKANYFLKDQLN